MKHYCTKVPGIRVQMGVCKVTSYLYQYTAIDDFTRYKILAFMRHLRQQILYSV